ncbi:Uncharacterised protein [[Clostridium] sordellii]|nr:Uncharacterised protein [[Clostridium] sordellii] [Paeniclostridium sordellii]
MPSLGKISFITKSFKLYLSLFFTVILYLAIELGAIESADIIFLIISNLGFNSKTVSSLFTSTKVTSSLLILDFIFPIDPFCSLFLNLTFISNCSEIGFDVGGILNIILLLVLSIIGSIPPKSFTDNISNVSDIFNSNFNVLLSPCDVKLTIYENSSSFETFSAVVIIFASTTENAFSITGLLDILYSDG